MGYKSKKIKKAVKFFSAEVDRNFLKVYAKNFVKVARIGEVMGSKRLPTLKKLCFKFGH